MGVRIVLSGFVLEVVMRLVLFRLRHSIPVVVAWALLGWHARATEPPLPRVEGSCLIDPVSGVVTDVLPAVHIQARGVEDVAIQLIEMATDASGDRVATGWIVRGERPGLPWLSFWIGIVEPARGTVVGFPVERLPRELAFVDGGRALQWTDADARHHLDLLATPRARRSGGRTPPLPTDHLESIPHAPDGTGT